MPGMWCQPVCVRSWLNGFNLHWAWELLQKEYAAASAAIEDCRYPQCPEYCMP